MRPVVAPVTAVSREAAGYRWPVKRDRDIEDFNARASGYDGGWLGRWHASVATKTSHVAAGAAPGARSIADIGCGTGHLLRVLSDELPSARDLVGIDPAAAMLEIAQQAESDSRVRYVIGVAEALPLPDASLDLIVTTTSFDHWADQRAGLRECRRVLRPQGVVVLADLIQPWLWPTTVIGRRGKARTPRQIEKLLAEIGLQAQARQRIETMIQAITATRIS